VERDEAPAPRRDRAVRRLEGPDPGNHTEGSIYTGEKKDTVGEDGSRVPNFAKLKQHM
jgi:hypothetical protein